MRAATLTRDHLPFEIQVRIQESVREAINRDILAFPKVEVGGKFVGHTRLLKGDQRPRLELEVRQHLDAGPGATRTATYHLPDGPYQERLFRLLEAQDAELEHLGTWHSHHPNGLQELSDGDIEGYFDSVNSTDYNLDYFFATLAINERGFEDARHYLFVRGHNCFYQIPNECVHVDATRLEEAVAVERARTQARVASMPAWFEGEGGGSLVVAEDAWIQEALPGARLVLDRRERTLGWKAPLTLAGCTVAASISYPANFPEQAPFAHFTAENIGFELRLPLRNPRQRAFSSARTVAELAIEEFAIR